MIPPAIHDQVLKALRERIGRDQGPVSLICFTIAGVQQFLDAARTTRDVWNGSYLVSCLMWKATERALEELRRHVTGLTRKDTARFVLIPAVEPQPFWRRWASMKTGNLEVAQFPNSVLLVAPRNEQAARDLALEMEKKVEAVWGAICQAAQKPLNSVLSSGAAKALWEYQTSWRRRNGHAWQQIFEIYTDVFELPDGDGFQRLAEQLGLDATRGAAGQLFELPMRRLSARKTLRDFEQFVHEGYRCSLCGQRTALTNELTARGVRDFWGSVRQINELRFAFRDPDRLCAVCTVRRLAPIYYFQGQFREIKGKIQFPSTSTIAAAAWVCEVLRGAAQDKKVRCAVSNFAPKLRDWQHRLGIQDPPEALVPFFEGNSLQAFAHCDGRWFYRETYTPDQLARDFGVDPGKAGKYDPPLPALTKALEGKIDTPADDYFAVIMADGDRMGEWMSGRQDPERFDLVWQQRLSTALADFADTAQRRLEHLIPAKVVYAGGDDVLAFAPRRCVLEALAILDLTFHQCVRLRMGYRRDSEPAPSLSVGCVVAKHKDPLKGAIVRAYEEMLKATAKEALGRNAFAIYRTTEGVAIGAPFYAGGRRTLRPLRALQAAFGGKLSPRVRWDLENLAEGLGQWTLPGLQDAQTKLIQRAFERHCEAPPDSKESVAVRRHAGEIFEALCRWPATTQHAQRVDPFRAFLDLLGLLIFLARHQS